MQVSRCVHGWMHVYVCIYLGMQMGAFIVDVRRLGHHAHDRVQFSHILPSLLGLYEIKCIKC